MSEQERIRACFCAFIEGSLITHNIDEVIQLFTEDVMGIGMGAQGIVRCREDSAADSAEYQKGCG